MSKHKEFLKQAGDLQGKRYFKECIIITLADIYWASALCLALT